MECCHPYSLDPYHCVVIALSRDTTGSAMASINRLEEILVMHVMIPFLYPERRV